MGTREFLLFKLNIVWRSTKFFGRGQLVKLIYGEILSSTSIRTCQKGKEFDFLFFSK